MKLDELLLLLLVFLAITLTGCSPCTEQQTIDFKPVPLEPIDMIIVDDLRPELKWDFTGCIPEQYEIYLFTKPTNAYQVDTGLGGLTGSTDKSWTPSVDLNIGTHYMWQVAAKAEGAEPGLHPSFGEFVVGPACEYPELLTPDPVWPVGRIEFISWFVWEYADPTCTPEGYAFQLSRNPEFTDLVINTREANPIKGWYDSTTLWNAGIKDDICTQYYWRVAAIDGPTDSPWSEVSSYYIDKYGVCLPQIVDAGDIPELAPICGDGIVNGDEQCDGDNLTMCLSGQQCINCKCTTVIEQCGNGIIDEGEQCDGDNLTMCLSGQVCENCQCITHIEAGPEFCIYKALQNSNCRESDYPESRLVETMMEGDSADLIALNPEYTHGLFEFADGKQCWLWLGLLDGEENPFGNCPVEIVDPPEAPRESACNKDLDERECIAAGGEWKEGMAAPYCACPEE
jgi:hypothetical protein